jgi:hypothetical protein
VVSADCEPTSASGAFWWKLLHGLSHRHHSNLNGTLFGMHYWSEYLRGQAATYRKFAEQADDPVVKRNLLELTSDCEEVVKII